MYLSYVSNKRIFLARHSNKLANGMCQRVNHKAKDDKIKKKKLIENQLKLVTRYLRLTPSERSLRESVSILRPESALLSTWQLTLGAEVLQTLTLAHKFPSSGTNVFGFHCSKYCSSVSNRSPVCDEPLLVLLLPLLWPVVVAGSFGVLAMIGTGSRWFSCFDWLKLPGRMTVFWRIIKSPLCESVSSSDLSLPLFRLSSDMRLAQFRVGGLFALGYSLVFDCCTCCFVWFVRSSAILHTVGHMSAISSCKLFSTVGSSKLAPDCAKCRLGRGVVCPSSSERLMAYVWHWFDGTWFTAGCRSKWLLSLSFVMIWALRLAHISSRWLRITLSGSCINSCAKFPFLKNVQCIERMYANHLLVCVVN